MDAEFNADGDEDSSVPSDLAAFGGVAGTCAALPDEALEPKSVANGFSRDDAMGGILLRLALLPDLDLFPELAGS
jgi:hypothetical protein